MSSWDPAALARVAAFARARQTSALVIVQGGEPVLEEYWLPTGPVLGCQVLRDGRTREDVASAQKSVTSLLVGAAVERGLVDVEEAVTGYVGPGWTHADPDLEARITVRHLLTMTSGLDDLLGAAAVPGSSWFYNLGAAYHSLKRVLVAVAGEELEALSRRWLFDPLGLDETCWVERTVPPATPEHLLGYHCYPDGRPFEGLVTSARDLVRLGSGLLSGLPDVSGDYLAAALRPTTHLNPAYGFLWWLNGQPWHLEPRRPDPVQGWLLPHAPVDLVGMLGAQGRSVHVVPSQELVVVRLGSDPGDTPLAGSRFGRELWRLLAGDDGASEL